MARTSVSVSPAVAANGRAALPIAEARNPGLPLDLDWVHEARFTNRSATERRAATLPTRRSVKKAWQAAWLLRAITCIDLTTLQGDDTPGTVRRLCAKARQPVRQDILDSLGVGHLPITVGAVCVYHNLVETAVEALAGSGIPVAAVSTGFSRWPDAFRDQAGGDSGVADGRGTGDRHRDLSGARPDGQLRPAVRRSARLP